MRLGSVIMGMMLIGCGLAANAQQSVKMDGQEYFLHKVEKGQTLYAISNLYKVELAELRRANRLTDSTAIRTDDVLIIPVSAVKEQAEEPKGTKARANQASKKQAYIHHVVQPGETLYSIARQYQDLSPQQIREMNKLDSDTLKVGQELRVPNTLEPRALFSARPPAGAAVPVDTTAKAANVVVVDSAALRAEKLAARYDMRMYTDLKRQYETPAPGKEVQNKRGIASWLDSEDGENQRRFYALYSGVPIGSVIKVRNLMNERVVYAKVIGHLPPSDAERNVMVKLSGGAAHYLNVLDERFLVELQLKAPIEAKQ